MKTFKYSLILTQRLDYSGEIQAANIVEATQEIERIMDEIPEDLFEYVSADTELIDIDEVG